MHFLITTAFAATEASSEVAPSGLAGVAATLGLNTKLFLAQLVNFGLLIVVLWRLLYRPLVRFMEERSKRIADGLENATRYDEKLAALEAERRATITKAEDEARAIVARASREADEVVNQAGADAAAEVVRIREHAAREAEQVKRQVLDEVRAEAADLVVLAAEKVIHQRLDPAADRQLIERALKESVSRG